MFVKEMVRDPSDLHMDRNWDVLIDPTVFPWVPVGGRRLLSIYFWTD